ncbi:thioredoxin family protein [Glaciecola sp. MH2013]|uniref:thioredoxin family protein n=1 Tax=Glaciecola sp. MH2013 TaxID=2785524 RepID=UPI00189C9C8C|nr:thioredoxin family protein [Glaciecola sp. MH2013]MBF7073286.1 thioredoxin family protein [Glaciecola sp. MH2013]
MLQSILVNHKLTRFRAAIFVAIWLTLIITFASPAKAADGNPKVLEQYIFTPSDEPLAQAKLTLQKASAENKYALIVLGAQWCHDSRGLAASFSDAKMQSILQTQYQTQFIDVGFLEDRRIITEYLGYPTYFATPTVLIVDPNTKTLVNIDTLNIWQNAASVELDTFYRQFSKWSMSSATANNPSSTPMALSNTSEYAQRLEKEQSARLQQGYAMLGPLLAESTTKGPNAKANQERFFALWDEVKAFRMALQKDIHFLRSAEHTSSSSQKAEENINEIYSRLKQRKSWEG